MTVNITLSSTLLLSDDGGDYEDEQCANLTSGEAKLQIRQKHYMKEKYGAEDVNVTNQAAGGTVSPFAAHRD